jgi:hypothetical protein
MDSSRRRYQAKNLKGWITVTKEQMRHSDARITLGVYGHVIGTRSARQWRSGRDFAPSCAQSGGAGEWIQVRWSGRWESNPRPKLWEVFECACLAPPPTTSLKAERTASQKRPGADFQRAVDTMTEQAQFNKRSSKQRKQIPMGLQLVTNSGLFPVAVPHSFSYNFLEPLPPPCGVVSQRM